MSLITLLTKSAPRFGLGENVVEFDAVMEDTFEASVQYTQYPIETGAQVTDHGIILPFRWRITGIVSNNPIQPEFTDFIGGALSNIVPDSSLVAAAAGLLTGLTSSNSETRAASALQQLISLMVLRVPFSVDAGDIQLNNMVITDIFRTKNPINEQGLEFTAQLQELPTLNTLLGDVQPTQDQLADDDPSKSQIAALIDRGEQALQDIGDATREAVDSILESLP